MAKALSPAYLRLGGTAADLLYFKRHPKKVPFLKLWSFMFELVSRFRYTVESGTKKA